jgi:Cu(I)/Ag(I) efflux system membrane fusion protein
MTDIEGRPIVSPPDSTGAAPAGRNAASERRRPVGAYLVVALVSLAIGAAGALVAVRLGGGAPAAAPGAGQPADHSAMAGMEASQSNPHAGMAGMESGAPSEQPAGATDQTVYISPARQQLIGVRTAEVTHRALDTTIRTVGTLAYDETRVTQIHTKIAGWIERLFVDYEGKSVRRGQPLFTVYSPDLVSTQNEYLLALEAQKRLGQSQFPDTRAGAESLLAATRERLRLWDITDAQIAELEKTRQPQRTLTLYSPFSGVVLERNAFAGQYITPETATFKIADLSTIWVLGQVFEYELPMVKLGQEAEIQFPYGPSNQTLKGKITFISPDVDPATRRVTIRIEFRNPGFEFKPDSYVTVVIHASGGTRLAVPQEAVIDTGVKRYVILARPNGYFEPREVEVGQPVDGYSPVLQGLEHGDTVVTSAQFLIDSESNLQEAMQAMSMSMPGMDMGGGKGPATPEQQPPAPPKPPEKKDGMPGMPGMDHSKHQG